MDSLGTRIARWMTELGEHRRVILLVGAVLVALYWLLAWIVRRFLPWLVQFVVVPVLSTVTFAVALVVLTVQALLAVPFRALHLRPFAGVFALGDGAVSVAGQLHTGLRALSRTTGRLRRRSRPAVAVVLVALTVVVWHQASCASDRQADACVRPTGVVADRVENVWSALLHLAQP